MTRTELIAALEKAEEGSRELDRDIALFFDLYPATINQDIGCFFDDPAKACGAGETWAPPSFTTSLDAALTLVPDGGFLDGLREGRKRITYAGDQHEPLGWFEAELQHLDGGRLKRERAKAFALAICIAALRARGEP